jgi:diguanylate cyclase (GGDEF)-like protein
LTIEESMRAYPVRLIAIVTCYNPYIDARHAALFVIDATGAIFVALETTPAVDLKPGQLVEITGVSAPGDFAPTVGHARARVLAQSHLPLTAPRVGMTDLLSGSRDGQWVEVEAVVHSVRQEGRNLFLELALRDGELSAVTVIDFNVDYSSLVNATVVLRGNAGPLFNHLRQMTGARVLFPDFSTLRVEHAAPAEPFELPVTRVRDLLRYTPKTGLQRRVRVRGVVTLLWPGRLICIEDGPEGLCAQTSDTLTAVPGRIADLIGFPGIGDFSPILVETAFRRTAVGQLVPPIPVSAQQAVRGEHDAHLITIDGQFLGKQIAGADPTILLSDAGLVFTASLPDKSILQAMPALEPGSWLRLTGICLTQSDHMQNSSGAGFPVGKSFRILIRSPQDIQVLSRPSWWNTPHALAILGVAALITIIASGVVVILRRQVKQQTAVIRDQLAETITLKDAAEFQATHDGLTGLQNRNAIFALLRREFDLVSRAGPVTGVIMLDLDHFKQVNDTYGHEAGDKVLKEAALRVSAAVRSSDMVGRYGGEEFLIVLPHCDAHQCLACAERVRLAIASEPIVHDGLLLYMTASLGAACALSHVHTEHQALVAADQALYRAKKNGRNQVVSLDLQASELPRPQFAPASPA